MTVLRYSSKPQERIVVCANPTKYELSEILENIMIETLEFLNDHRYDPYEIYDDEFIDELKKVPDPKHEPIEMINEFLDVLRTLGKYTYF